MKPEDEKILEEARKMLGYIKDFLEELSPTKEHEFIEDLLDQIERDGWISEKQLSWLRTIYDKV